MLGDYEHRMAYHKYVFVLLLLLHFLFVKGVDFTIEEPIVHRKARQLHRIRHSKVTSGTHPYMSASSTLTDTTLQTYESFSLNCPHVIDASNDEVGIEVTWTLNDTIWLKVENGEKKIYNKLSTFSKRKVGGKTVLRILLNDGRYLFDYDELTGDFSMEIRPVEVHEDAGVWQCHVTVHQKGNTHTLTSRSRVKIPHMTRNHGDRQLHYVNSQSPLKEDHETMRIAASSQISSFTRTNNELVHISRDGKKVRQTVIFDRQLPIAQEKHAQKHALPAIDYEMSLGEEPYVPPKSKIRSAYTEYNNAHSSYSISVVFIVSAACLRQLIKII